MPKNNLTREQIQKAKADLQSMPLDGIKSRIRLLEQSRMSIMRTGEDSDAADRALFRDELGLSLLRAELRRRNAA